MQHSNHINVSPSMVYGRISQSAIPLFTLLRTYKEGGVSSFYCSICVVYYELHAAVFFKLASFIGDGFLLTGRQTTSGELFSQFQGQQKTRSKSSTNSSICNQCACENLLYVRIASRVSLLNYFFSYRPYWLSNLSCLWCHVDLQEVVASFSFLLFFQKVMTERKMGATQRSIQLGSLYSAICVDL